MKPLAGMRVVDFTSMIAGPYCTRLLADCGAEVLKIEEPHGDHMRTRPPLRDGHSTYFGHLNAGKKSVALDLKSAEGREAAQRLVAASDVVVENFRPGVMKRLGLDYAHLVGRKTRSRLLLDLRFRPDRPARRAAGLCARRSMPRAASITRSSLYQDGQDRPAKTGIFVADVLAAVYAFGAIQTALIGAPAPRQRPVHRRGADGFDDQPAGLRMPGGAVPVEGTTAALCADAGARRLRDRGTGEPAQLRAACRLPWATPNGRPTRASPPSRPARRTGMR